MNIDTMNMYRNETYDEELSHLIADEYAGKILAATYNQPMPVQQISKDCGIPIAVAYRRMSKMEELGLVRCVGFKEVYRGKKVSYYQCAIHIARVIFSEGMFKVDIDFLQDSDMIRIGDYQMNSSPIINGASCGQ